jgi:hypothetical protein
MLNRSPVCCSVEFQFTVSNSNWDVGALRWINPRWLDLRGGPFLIALCRGLNPGIYDVRLWADFVDKVGTIRKWRPAAKVGRLRLQSGLWQVSHRRVYEFTP